MLELVQLSNDSKAIAVLQDVYCTTKYAAAIRGLSRLLTCDEVMNIKAVANSDVMLIGDASELKYCGLVAFKNEEHRVISWTMAILEHLQKQGLGERVLQCIEDHARFFNYRLIRTDILSTHTWLANTLERNGYELQGVLKDYAWCGDRYHNNSIYIKKVGA